ncbi:hypothetical protein BDZ91DRAFT_767857 [Kalaharituber pfeilii]|nr:hypothetical protein BDZ91DRAFT_767857 [Kalaharituber pfeilii]
MSRPQCRGVQEAGGMLQLWVTKSAGVNPQPPIAVSASEYLFRPRASRYNIIECCAGSGGGKNNPRRGFYQILPVVGGANSSRSLYIYTTKEGKIKPNLRTLGAEKEYSCRKNPKPKTPEERKKRKEKEKKRNPHPNSIPPNRSGGSSTQGRRCIRRPNANQNPKSKLIVLTANLQTLSGGSGTQMEARARRSVRAAAPRAQRERNLRGFHGDKTDVAAGGQKRGKWLIEAENEIIEKMHTSLLLLAVLETPEQFLLEGIIDQPALRPSRSLGKIKTMDGAGNGAFPKTVQPPG